MRDESQALVVQQNGNTQLSAEKTKALWASAGANVRNPEVVRALAAIGDHYSLDPALGEISILGDKVYINFEGYLRIAEQHPQYEGYELRPMNEQERKDAKVGADEFAYVCHVYRKDRRFPSVGYGVASDLSVSAAPLRVYKREIAEKRAFHRALRMAFRAGIPDYDETIERMEYEQPVVIEQLPSPVVAEKPPAPPAPDWPRFWAHIKGLGVEHEEAHRALGIGSLKEWSGSLDEAITAIERYVFTRDTAAAQQVSTPAQPVEDAATSAQVRAIYDLGRHRHRLTERQTEEKSLALFGALPCDLTQTQAKDFIKALQPAQG